MLKAAAVVFGRDGFQAASMDEIARRSGITKALLYQYFGSKEGLYDAAIERGRSGLLEALRDRVSSVEAGPQRLVAFVQGYFDFVEENRGARWLLYGEASITSANAMRQRNAELIAGLLREDALRQGRDVDADSLQILAHDLVGAGEQVGRWWVERHDVPKETVVQHFEEMAGGAIDAVFRAAPRRR
jgi:AcrR family transcriptional regulator